MMIPVDCPAARFKFRSVLYGDGRGGKGMLACGPWRPSVSAGPRDMAEVQMPLWGVADEIAASRVVDQTGSYAKEEAA